MRPSNACSTDVERPVSPTDLAALWPTGPAIDGRAGTYIRHSPVRTVKAWPCGLLAENGFRQFGRGRPQLVDYLLVTVQLIPGASRDDALARLTNVGNELTRVGTGTDDVAFQDYCLWVANSVRMLSSCLPAHVIEPLILTRRYWALQDIGASTLGRTQTPHLRLLLNTEIAERSQAIHSAVQELANELRSWDDIGRLVMADTNLFLQHRQKFDEIPWIDVIGARIMDNVTLVIPMAVIRELDGKKKQQGTIRFRAAYSLSRIERLFGDVPAAGNIVPLVPTDSSTPATVNGLTRGQLGLRVTVDEIGHSRYPNADDEIITQALTVQALAGRPVTLVSFDTNMAFQARQAGLPVVRPGNDDLADEFQPKTPKAEQKV